MLKKVFFILILSFLIQFTPVAQVLAAEKNGVSFVGNLNKTYSNFNKQLDSIVKMQKAERKARKKLRQIEYFKYQTLEDEVKFEEKKKKKENSLIKRLNKLNGNSGVNAELVRSQLNKNSLDLSTLFLFNLF